MERPRRATGWGRSLLSGCRHPIRQTQDNINGAMHRADSDFLSVKGRELAGGYTEVESGKRKDRPQLAEAIEATKRVKVVIAKLDRLARNAPLFRLLRLPIVEGWPEFFPPTLLGFYIATNTSSIHQAHSGNSALSKNALIFMVKKPLVIGPACGGA